MLGNQRHNKLSWSTVRIQALIQRRNQSSVLCVDQQDTRTDTECPGCYVTYGLGLAGGKKKKTMEKEAGNMAGTPGLKSKASFTLSPNSHTKKKSKYSQHKQCGIDYF